MPSLRTPAKLAIIPLTGAILLGASASHAQQGTGNSATVLPEVIVTATPTDDAGEPDPSIVSPGANTAKEKLKSVPGAVSIVPRTNFDLGRGAYLEDFIRFTPGVLIQSNQGAEDTKVSTRGSGTQEDDNIIGLSLLVDGIPMNQGDGEAFLHDIDLQSVKYAEVYRGADAFRYGSVTLGGAINLVTFTGREGSPLSARVTFGSFGYTEQQVSSSWSHGPWDMHLSVLNHTLEGFREWSQENFQKVEFSLGYKFSEQAENRLYFFYGRLAQNNPSGLTKEEMYANPTQTSPESIQQRWSTKWDYERIMDSFVMKGDDWKLTLALNWNHRQQTQNSEFDDDFLSGGVRFYSDDYSADLVYENTSDLFGRKNRFTAGLIPMWEPESDSFYADPNGRIGKVLFADRTYYLTLPFFFENQHYLTKQFSILTGAQVVYVDRIFRDRLKNDPLGDQSHDDHFLALNPKLGLSYEWNEKCLAYLNFSRSFQPPSFDQSIGIIEGEDGGHIYNHILSQKGWTLEVGTRGESGPFTWDFAIYRSWLRDELLDLNNPQGVPLGTVNAPHTIHQGLEIGLETEVLHSVFIKDIVAAHDSKDAKDGKSIREPRKTDRLLLDQTYNLADYRFSNDATYGNNRIAGNPEQFYKAELRYEHPSGFYLGANVEWNITKYPVDEANTLFADPYALMGVRAGYKTKKGLQVYFEAKNLLDKTYAAVVEPIADARTADDVDSFHPGNGRAFYGGIAWVW